jgi:hypothetical protein
MPRGKDQKTISKRIDLHSWRKAHPLRSARMVLVLVCFLVAGGWLAYAYGTKKSDALYNPGHVTTAHATIENNCAACHAPDPNHKGQFLKAVSDNACMTCHDAPGHAPTQLTSEEGQPPASKLVLAKWVKDNGLAEKASEMPSENSTTAQPGDAHHGMRMVSSQCALCHVEHRGREALAAVSDNHCTVCHADISKAISPGKTAKVQARVVAFSKEAHPDFGMHLPKGDDGKTWVDPTKLNFNHKVHIVDQKLNDCTQCHKSASATGVGYGGYMQPVNYQQHCASCHPIKVTGIKGLTHVRIEIVRAQVQAAMQQSAVDRYGAGGAGAPSSGGRRGAKTDAGPADEGEWLKQEIEKVNKNIAAVQKSCAKCHEMKDENAPAVAAASEAQFHTQLLGTWNDEATVVEIQQRRSRRPGGASETPAPPAAETTPSEVKPPSGETPAPTPAPAPSPKPRKPIAPVKLQTTEPTGITKSPRRWFASSRFDHRAHRNMTCVDCHSKLDNLDKVDAIADEAVKTKLTAFATETKQVLSPGMQWTVYQYSMSGDKQNVTEATKSCTDCHRADTRAQRFTTTACVACHAYHDHSQELYPDGHPPLAAPVAAAVEEPPTEPAPAPPAETPAEPAPAPTPAEAAPAPATPAPPAEAPAPTAPEEVKPAEPAPPSEPAPTEPAPARKSRRPKSSGA